MLYDEEKDYVMRMIREVSRVLFSIIFGKVSVIPLLQVGGVSFGSSLDSVRKAFGQYKEYRKSPISKNTSDDFGFCHVYYDKENRCEAIEFFSGCKVEVDDTIVFPGDVDKAIKKLGDFEQKYDCFINLRQSIGITASDGKHIIWKERLL